MNWLFLVVMSRYSQPNSIPPVPTKDNKDGLMLQVKETFEPLEVTASSLGISVKTPAQVQDKTDLNQNALTGLRT